MTIFRRRRETIELLQAERERSRQAIAGETAERRRLQVALDALPVGVVLADGDGRIQLRNRSAVFTGHEGVLISEAIEHVFRLARRGDAAEKTVEFFGPPRRVLMLRADQLESGDLLATVDDISERARVDAVRTDFVANISHELKTPIGALAVLAEALADSEDRAVMRRLAEKMVGEAHRVSCTIDDLMELSRIELGGEAVHETVDIDMVIADAVDRVGALAAQQGVTVRVQPEAVEAKAIGDSRQLVSALANLLDNAVKYSEPGSTVEVGAEMQAGVVDLIVNDHGIGIPARDHDRIFERFYRVDRGRSRVTGGTGLGLAIVRHVATNHGGEVFLRSQEGVGSTFTLRIPSSEK